MKIVPIGLMLLVLVLVRSAAGQTNLMQTFTPRIIITEEPIYDRTFTVVDQRFGFEEQECLLSSRMVTTLYAGPFGSREVPFSATQGLIGGGAIMMALIVLPVAAVARGKWKRREG